MNAIYPIILAGGTGTRFWPKSRMAKPKQYLSLFDDTTLIQSTVDRLLSLAGSKKLIMVSSMEQKQWIREQLPWMRTENVLYEPDRRNTAPAIGLAALQVLARDPDAIMILSPADHLIRDTTAFVRNVKTAIQWITQHPEALVTLGVPPRYPATGFGYIQYGDEIENTGVYRVLRFSEKPDIKHAKQYLDSGDYLWNCGLFIWRADTILNAIAQFMPKLHQGLEKIKPALGTSTFFSVLKQVYSDLPSRSIDYGIMEHTKNAYVVRAEFDWNDIGSWKEVFVETPKDNNDNVVKGDVYLKDTKHCYIEASNTTVAVIGLENKVIVQTPDALLICDQDKAQEIKWLVNELERNRRKDLL